MSNNNTSDVGVVTSDVGVLDKSLRIVNAVAERPRSLAELVVATELHRATAHRLAQSLVVHGLFRRDDLGRFCLGARLVELGRVASAGLPLADVAKPALEALTLATGESAQLYVRDGEQRLCLASVESPHSLRTIVAVGARLPLDRGSAGAVLSGKTPRSGFAESVGQREAGVASVSAPIFDTDGVLRGAVSVSGPIERITKSPGKRYGTAVVAAAAAIQSAAGWSA